MPFSLNTLKTELTTDPTSRGYAPFLAVANDQKVADLLNTPVAGASGYRNDITPAEIMRVIVSSEFATMPDAQVRKLSLMFVMGKIDASDSNTRSVFVGIFSGMSATLTALTAMAQKNYSRAETLFGVGYQVTAEQVGSAR